LQVRSCHADQLSREIKRASELAEIMGSSRKVRVHKSSRQVRMTTLKKTASGAYKARQRIPREAAQYSRIRDGLTFEFKFFRPAGTPYEVAVRDFAEWLADVEERIALYRAQNRADKAGSRAVPRATRRWARLPGSRNRTYACRHCRRYTLRRRGPEIREIRKPPRISAICVPSASGRMTPNPPLDDQRRD
jgi:hypothetical protein